MSGKGRRRALLCLLLALMTLSSACGADRGAGEAMLLEPGSAASMGEHATAPVVRGDMYRAVYVPAAAVYYRPEAVICGDLAGATLVRILVKRDQEVRAGDDGLVMYVYTGLAAPVGGFLVACAIGASEV